MLRSILNGSAKTGIVTLHSLEMFHFGYSRYPTSPGRLVNFYLSSTMEEHSISSIPGRLINPVMQLPRL